MMIQNGQQNTNKLLCKTSKTYEKVKQVINNIKYKEACSCLQTHKPKASDSDFAWV